MCVSGQTWKFGVQDNVYIYVDGQDGANVVTERSLCESSMLTISMYSVYFVVCVITMI